MSQNKYELPENSLSVPGEANTRFGSLSAQECDRADKNGQPAPRMVGGDQGDVGHHGYHVEEGRTYLDGAILFTSIDMSEDGKPPHELDIVAIAQEIVDFAFDSIGLDVVA